MTHNERVLALLEDGKPHTHHELYGLHVIAHSRVADLRKQGHTIVAWRDGDDYLYRLLKAPVAPDPGGCFEGAAFPGATRVEHAVPSQLSFAPTADGGHVAVGKEVS